MTEKEKLLKYLNHKGYSKKSFSEKTGLSLGFLTQGNSIGVDKARLILKAYPDLNIFWLVMDEGNMIIDSEDIKEQIPQSITDKLNNDLVAHLKKVDGRLVRLEELFDLISLKTNIIETIEDKGFLAIKDKES